MSRLKLVILLGLGLLAATPATNTQLLAGQNVVVLLDDSGSMDDRMRSRNGVVRKIDAAKKALLSVLNQVPDDAKVGVLVLNGQTGDGEWIIPLGPVDKRENSQAISRIKAYGGTPLGQFMKSAADELLKLRETEHYGSYRLLIVSDGEANDGNFVEAFLPDIMARGISVDVIGVDMKQTHSLAKQVHSYRKADDSQALQVAISEALAESSATDSDTNESDFELLASIPGELAAAALGALTSVDNQPIGNAMQAGLGESRGLGTSRTNNTAAPPGGNQNRGRPKSGFATLIAAFIFFSIVASIVKGLFRSR